MKVKALLIPIAIVLLISGIDTTNARNLKDHYIINVDLITGEQSIYFPESQNITTIEGYIPKNSQINIDPHMHQVIGPDDRTRVPNTTTYPWSAVVNIFYDSPPGQLNVCSGSMLGRSVIVTAAHCIYQYNGTGLGSNYRIRPGRDGNTIPWECRGISISYPGEWKVAVDQNPNNVPVADYRYDYGAIRISCRVGDVTGLLAYSSTNDNDLVGKQVQTTGYPAVNPTGVDNATSMWTGSGDVVSSTHTGILRHNVDATGGQSGSPIWLTQDVPVECSVPCVMGIHAAGISPPDGITPNYGVGITPVVLSDLALWKNYSHPFQIRIPVLIKESVPVN